MRRILAGVAATVVMLTGSAVSAEATVRTTTYKASAPCIYEDGSTQLACVWDARSEGNGFGSSVVNLDDGHRWVYVSSHRLPRKIDRKHVLVVRIKGQRADVIYGRTTIAKNVRIHHA